MTSQDSYVGLSSLKCAQDVLCSHLIYDAITLLYFVRNILARCAARWPTWHAAIPAISRLHSSAGICSVMSNIWPFGVSSLMCEIYILTKSKFVWMSVSCFSTDIGYMTCWPRDLLLFNAIGGIVANWGFRLLNLPFSLGDRDPCLTQYCFGLQGGPAKWHLIPSYGFSRVHECDRRHTYWSTDGHTDRPGRIAHRCRLIINFNSCCCCCQLTFLLCILHQLRVQLETKFMVQWLIVYSRRLPSICSLNLRYDTRRSWSLIYAVNVFLHRFSISLQVQVTGSKHAAQSRQWVTGIDPWPIDPSDMWPMTHEIWPMTHHIKCWKHVHCRQTHNSEVNHTRYTCER